MNIGHKCAEWVDVQCRRWRSWRAMRLIKADPLLSEVCLKSIEFKDETLKMVMTAPALMVLAQEAAHLLALFDAKNHLEFKMITTDPLPPRLMRITLQWDDGESPAEKAVRLEAELAEVKRSVAASVPRIESGAGSAGDSGRM